MTKDEWAAWVDCHTSMFGMGEEDITMVVSWRPALEYYSIDELRAASAELLKQAPKFRNEHVTWFYRILAKARRTVRHFATTCTCKTCRGEANADEETGKFSFKEAAKRYEESKRTNEQVPF